MRIYSTILALLLTVPALAVDTLQVTTPDPVTEAWRWSEFDQSSGLVGGVRNVYEDRDGNIWFATDRGVQRYDGRTWTTYTTEDGLANDRASEMVQTRDGAMWFGTVNGLSRFDPVKGEGGRGLDDLHDGGRPGERQGVVVQGSLSGAGRHALGRIRKPHRLDRRLVGNQPLRRTSLDHRCVPGTSKTHDQHNLPDIGRRPLVRDPRSGRVAI